ncbi:Very-long-chain enoyl-CoA reductase [Nibea albiflora]|uniref:Very-long-chain enoyl-CoA reductase n=1 Tax=Nibea albiflora TaxID=240163 RepID=A0ACB7EY30_NIBAL|nr:Very-long-chain enoyl-CoA reductase [Nibea albiflora]
MDILALEAKNVNGAEPEKKATQRPKPKAPKKAKRIVYFEVEIVDLKTKEKLLLLDKVEPTSTVLDIKSLFHKSYPKWYPARQSLRLDPKAKSLRDEEILQTLPVGTTASFYFSDLGPQLTWGTVFLTECVGPLIIYLMFYFRLPFIYSPKYDFTSSKNWVVHLACMCHSFHYIKRILETMFVHRISHGTMPLRNIFKNCGYYWCSAAWMAYYINHPLYTPPFYGQQQVNMGLYIFLFCQVGNFSIHVALRNLKLPVMTQCVPVAFFTLVAFIQMTVWAKGKHRSYLKEFRDYPTLRSSILPFIL